MEKIKALWVKYEELIVYLIVGVLTTIVSWTCQFAWNALVFGNPAYPTATQNLVLSMVNWVSGVIFAYFTNRRFVFKSKNPMVKEAPKFVLSRVSTLLMDIVLRQVFGALNINTYVSTLVIAVIVTVSNYIFSKLFVFNKKKNREAE